MKFTIVCEMEERWVPHFLAMLKYMQHLGAVGGSRKVSIYADGDGDFHPKFKWNKMLPSDAEPVDGKKTGDYTYDAG